ncbi:MAG TPA: proline racemase family protein [Acetobacteraceae bacterium]|nr:proline racemase family protein [Acetobacteraceae bacterium]
MRWSRSVTVVGVHAEGEVGRVITGGVLPPPGASMFARMRHLAEKDDGLRRLLLFEPRGAVNHSVNLVTPPCAPEADFGLIIMESQFYVPMSGSNMICAVTAVLETGLVPMREPETRLTVDTPGGLVHVRAECRGGRCALVSFRNVPSFVLHRDRAIKVAGWGEVLVDIAYGGMMYAIVDAQKLGFGLVPDEARELVALGERIKAAAAEQLPAVHPENPEIHTVNQTLFAGPLIETANGKTARNTVVISPGRLDRSPCGTGTSARLALLHARGEIAPGEVLDHVSIIGSHFFGTVEEVTRAGPVPAVINRISGRGFITGITQYGLDPEDPYPEGFTVPDLWFQ